jgi:AcrR family transcriptional regulator
MTDHPAVSPAKPTEQGATTRQRILDVAVRLFAEQGYDKTTMRGIAQAAGLSVGNAYYYFSGKDELVQAFYSDIQTQHRQWAEAALTSTTFTSRLRAVFHAGIDTMAPYHDFAASFIKVAIEPASPSSPFSPQSTAAREASIDLFREVVGGARLSVDPRLRAELPELLWLIYLGLTLFWVYDRSPGQVKTRTLIDRATPLVSRLLKLTRLPVLRSTTSDLLALIKGIRP